MPKQKKKVRDLKPVKDAKGGRSTPQPVTSVSRKVQGTGRGIR